MASKPLKNLRTGMLEELCGKNPFQNVILTTTMWDEVDEKTGEDRERELKINYWRTMLGRGSTTSRFMRTRESAFNLIDPLIEAANRRISVLLQDELVVMRKSLPAIADGLELFSTMGQLVSQRKDLLRRIRHEMSRSDSDKMTLEPLQEEHQKLQNSLEATVIEMRRLRLPLGQRLLIMTDKFFSNKLESLNSKSLISKGLSSAAPNTELPTPPIDSYAPVSPADHLLTIGTISKDPINETHESPPGSTSHTPLPIAYVLPLGQGTDQFKPSPIECFPLTPFPVDATGQSRTHTVLQGTITTLQFIQQIVGLAPVPGLQSLVGVVLNISEVVNVSFRCYSNIHYISHVKILTHYYSIQKNMYAAEDALVELARKAGSFMVTLVSLVEQGSISAFSDSDSQAMNSVIEGLTKCVLTSLYSFNYFSVLRNFTEK